MPLKMSIQFPNRVIVGEEDKGEDVEYEEDDEGHLVRMENGDPCDGCIMDCEGCEHNDQ